MLALWMSDCGKFGKFWEGWGLDMSHLRRMGFYVLELETPVGIKPLSQEDVAFKADALKVLTEGKMLHGLFSWGHGSFTSYGSRKSQLGIAAWLRKPAYKLALALINGCQVVKMKAIASRNGIARAPDRVMFKMIEGWHPFDVVRPGEQGTVPLLSVINKRRPQGHLR